MQKKKSKKRNLWMIIANVFGDVGGSLAVCYFFLVPLFTAALVVGIWYSLTEIDFFWVLDVLALWMFVSIVLIGAAAIIKEYKGGV